MNINVTPVHEDYAARLGQAGTDSDADRCDAILAEIADAGLETALAVLAVQTRNLVWMLTLEHGEEAARKLFETTIIAGQAILRRPLISPSPSPTSRRRRARAGRSTRPADGGHHPAALVGRDLASQPDAAVSALSGFGPKRAAEPAPRHPDLRRGSYAALSATLSPAMAARNGVVNLYLTLKDRIRVAACEVPVSAIGSQPARRRHHRRCMAEPGAKWQLPHAQLGHACGVGMAQAMRCQPGGAHSRPCGGASEHAEQTVVTERDVAHSYLDTYGVAVGPIGDDVVECAVCEWCPFPMQLWASRRWIWC